MSVLLVLLASLARLSVGGTGVSEKPLDPFLCLQSLPVPPQAPANLLALKLALKLSISRLEHFRDAGRCLELLVWIWFVNFCLRGTS